MSGISNELAQASGLGFAINLGNPVLAYQEDGQKEPGGISVSLARKIANELGLTPRFHPYPTAGSVVDDSAANLWDIAFLAVDPKREEQLAFTTPYITIEGTCLVLRSAGWKSVEEMDKSDVVINVGKGAAYDLFLTRYLKNATLNRCVSSQEAIDRFLAGEGDMAAGIRQPLVRAAKLNPDFVVLPDSFTTIRQAVCVPRAKPELFARVSALIERWLQNGELAELIERESRDF
ncbi:ABC transporter substrate-binding protein [Leminorella grimontii]|uniref:ABC transporter substrate-binding protein n=1 Tax=Leminorella grimontii TaxID=82981 RepID=A0AAV5MY74_9GAMM|nr:transporter substrate-binding domain-containing protein [Leminorella grimontii]KFC96172.1 hypothetical protein GLGR_1347 [Leminorella grimontii ATCC 33999 = DSM 5078]GKX54640.1 ABC transporter substrate-binding protein [Leminorella grimontii]VFS58767.1 cystine transporter subunit [Leminorella grimontii]